MAAGDLMVATDPRVATGLTEAMDLMAAWVIALSITTPVAVMGAMAPTAARAGR